MRKMKLDRGELVVESCAAAEARVGLRGTVQGNDVMELVTHRVTCYSCGGSTCVATGSPCVNC